MIHILPDHVINQIAAGEVVERPASIVKELVENSLDAGANHISIHIRNGGKSLIRISDNGSGITAEDLPKAVLRHATSKIENIEDLDRILTLGFRGEALASIASVSQTYIETKTADSISASTITLDHGNIESQHQAARETGTTINIENLFAKVPARRKFLKSDRQELAAILRLIQEIALAYPQVHFELFHNGQELINTPARKSILERFYDLFPAKDLQNNMIAISNEEEGMKLQALISSPIVKRSNRQQQMIAINGRTIKDYRLAKCIEDAYHSFLLTSEHPIFFLQLQLEPEVIDVNVHPRKMEVRISNLETVMSFLYRSVRGVLEKQILSVKPDLNAEFGIRNSEWHSPAQFTPSIFSKAENHPQNNIPYSEFRIPHSEFSSVHSPNIGYEANELFPEQHANKPIRVLSQITNSYILCTTDKSLMLFDQHAAHERFIYEQLKKTRSEHSTQALLVPTSLSTTAEQSALLEEQQENFANFGISLEQGGPNQWLITGVPNLPKSLEIDWATVVMNSFDILHQESLTHSLQDHEDDILHTMACKAAVKFNDKLSMTELQRLIDDVAYLPGIYTCPHGRPFRLELTFNELDRYFKRH